MPIPRNWSEELIYEWLCLEGYLTEVGIPVGTGGRGGRKEADIVGVKVSVDNNKRQLQIYHVEVGQLGGKHVKNVARLKDKFSNERRSEIVERYKERMAFDGEVKYQKLYINIWEFTTKVDKLQNDSEITGEKIEVWTPSKLFSKVFQAIETWGVSTLPESHWMLKLLENLLEVRRRNESFELPVIKYQRKERDNF